MTRRQVNSEASALKAILGGDDDFLRTAVRTAIRAALIAIAGDSAGQRQVLAVELANRGARRAGQTFCWA